MSLTAIPPILDAWRATILKHDRYLGSLPDTLSGHGGEYLRARNDETGLEFAPPIMEMSRQILWLTSDTVLGDAHLSTAIVGSTYYERTILAKHSTPSNNIVLTLPANATPGKWWCIVHAPGQTGQVRLRPGTGATLQGGTADMRLEGPYSMASVMCIANDTGSAAQFIASGAVTGV